MLNTSRSYRGMVVAPHHLASQAGLSVLRDGGNAVEASVAVAATLAVVYPHMTGIGGDAFWLIASPDGAVRSIEGCGAAARAATPSLYGGLDAIPRRGPLAANTVAGTVSAWQGALAVADGRLPLSRLLRDAIDHARDGVAVTADGAAAASSKRAEFENLPGDYRKIFELDGRPPNEGSRLRQNALAATLTRLAEQGLQDFYTGGVAADLSADLAALGSPVDAADLAQHAWRETLPLTLTIGGARLFNTPPPTQGIASLLILALFDRLTAKECDGFAHVHGLVEATKRAFAFRDKELGDAGQMSADPQALLNDRAALDRLAASIDRRQASPWPQPPSGGDTTWFGVVDGDGTAVSAIQSLFFEFGSGVVLPRTGVVWQNRGSSFSLTAGLPTTLGPGRRPFHTLNPAIAKFDDGRLMAYGTMGGEGQPQTQAAIFTRYARYGMPLQAAVTAPRWVLGRTWGDDSVALRMEGRFPPTLLNKLRKAGHPVELTPPFASMMGHAGALVHHPDGLIEGAADPRSDGSVAAW